MLIIHVTLSYKMKYHSPTEPLENAG